MSRLGREALSSAERKASFGEALSGSLGAPRLLLALLGLALALRVLFLDRSLWADEVIILGMAKAPLGEILASLKSEQSFAPFYLFLLHGWLYVSEAAWWARLFSVLAGVATCYLIYRLGRETWGEGLALGALLLVVLSPLHIWESQTLKFYALSTLLIVASTLFFLRIQEGRARGRDWALYPLFATLSLYTFYFAFLALLAQNIIFLLCCRSLRALLRWALLQAGILLLFSPWLLNFIQHARSAQVFHVKYKLGLYMGGVHLGGLMRSSLDLLGIDPRFLGLKEFRHFFSWTLTALLLGLAIGALIIILCGAHRYEASFGGKIRGRTFAFVLMALTPLVSALGVNYFLGFAINARYFVACFLFFSYILAAFAMWQKVRKVALMCAIALGVLWMIRYPVLYQPVEDWRQAMAYISEKTRPGDLVALNHSSAAYEFYGPKALPWIDLDQHFLVEAGGLDLSRPLREGAQGLKESLSSAGRVWVIYGKTPFAGGERVLDEWLGHLGFRKVEKRLFHGITLSLYSRERHLPEKSMRGNTYQGS